MSKMIFNTSPATHSAMVPRLAVPIDVSRRLVYTADYMSLEYSPIPPSPDTFVKSRGQLRATSASLHYIRNL